MVGLEALGVRRHLLLSSPPDADHVVAGDGHHVLVVVTAGNLGEGSGSVSGERSRLEV